MSELNKDRISEHVLEVRYTPTPEFLDYRGVFAKAISALLQLKHWKIVDNRIDIFDEGQTTRAFVSFRNFGLVVQNSYDKSYFPNQANKLVKFLLSQKPFTDPIHLDRIGVRSRFAYHVDCDYSTLLQRYRSNYYSINDKAISIYGSEAIDVGLFITLKNVNGKMNSQTGPMPKEQLATFFPNEKELPDVSIYSDIDYWNEPNKDLSSGQLAKYIKDYSTTSWEIIEQLTELVKE